ncbi:LOW QUALITY PROTEIN: dynein regulatory complex subunit 6 [Eublepharis macularius]|uniref:LOW QUALITY PROTEIN: dynein regulatory complex subunit 6 n=1 Tax=Eublepharis macularius TaxID=481883 RepID=A0AA97JSL4_EUBMA|nr:LOW QUALITY PROTEIN: dynein regulatory complex subunit 6 [Eublepharis macularius]
MATFRNTDPALRSYFKKYSIPDVYEALLSGLLIMCPNDPLKFLEEKIKEIMENGLPSILWNMCIDPALSLRLKVISDTYLHTLLGLDDDQLMTPELYDKAWNFYSANLKRKCFEAWTKYCIMRKNAQEILERKFAAARRFYRDQVVRRILRKWKGWLQFRKGQHKRAAARIGKVFELTLQKITLKAWRKETRYNRRAKKCIAHLQKVEIEETDNEVEVHHAEVHERHLPERRPTERIVPLDHNLPAKLTGLGKLPQRALVQIFHNLNLIDLGRCAQVCRSWNAMIHVCSVWSTINFSEVKDKMRDNVGGDILMKWRASVVHLNLRGCATLQWLTFKSIGQCRNLQELNVSECQGLNDELMRLVSEGCPALLRLNLSHTDITNGTLRLLSRSFSNLQYLSLAYCRKFTDKGLQYLGSGRGCHKLIYLDLSGCLQKNLGCPQEETCQSSCSWLEKFKTVSAARAQPEIEHGGFAMQRKNASSSSGAAPCFTQISDAGLKSFIEGFAGSNLRELTLANCSNVTNSSLINIAQRCTSLMYLNMRSCQAVTDSGIEVLATLPSLTHINISGIDVSDQTLEALGRNGKIKEITISECKSISDGGIKKFSVDVKNLDCMDFSFCQQLSNHSIKHLVFNCHKLTSLTMVGCPRVTDVGVQYLAAACTYLHYLDISGCIQITDKALKSLWKGCLQLRILKMLYCPLITRQAVSKYTSRLQKYEYNNDSPPQWFGYDTGSQIYIPKKQKKSQHGRKISTLDQKVKHNLQNVRNEH